MPWIESRIKATNQRLDCCFSDSLLVTLAVLNMRNIPAASLPVCVCVITAICAHIPVLYITSTDSQLMMPKHRDADCIAMETGS